MHQNDKQKWDNRYKDAEFAFGKDPNLFFKEWLLTFKAGNILLPADGEGRNGVFAAELGWTVTSFDLSVEGQHKAMLLAKEKNVSLNYIVADFDYLNFDEETFDVIALVYAHFPAEKKSAFHKKLKQYLKPGGIIILEAFGKKHLDYRKLNPSVGGPTDIDTLYSKEEIMADFEGFELLLLKEEEIDLSEGMYHIGKGSVVRFIGKKL